VEFEKTRAWLEEEPLQYAAARGLGRCLVVPQVCETLAISMLRGCTRGTVDQTRRRKVTIAQARPVLLEMLHEDVLECGDGHIRKYEARAQRDTFAFGEGLRRTIPPRTEHVRRTHAETARGIARSLRRQSRGRRRRQRGSGPRTRPQKKPNAVQSVTQIGQSTEPGWNAECRIRFSIGLHDGDGPTEHAIRASEITEVYEKWVPMNRTKVLVYVVA
jgi:hypothetical protein